MSETKVKRPYTDNARFLEELKNYKRALRDARRDKLPLPRIPPYVGEYFLLIAKGLASKGQYNGYSYIDEMIMDSVENCLRYCENYNINKSKTRNPFNYFTTIIAYAFWRRIAVEHKQQYIKYKLFDASSVLTELTAEDLAELPDDIRTDLVSNLGAYANINDFVTKYEEKQAAKKSRSRKKARATKLR